MSADTSSDRPDRSLLRLAPDDLSPAVSEAIMSGAVAAVADVAALSVSGSGTIMCLQGVLTNDIEAPGATVFVYGAVLTPKGMIVTDLWITRMASDVHLSVPSAGHEPLAAVFQRSLPPRLARVEDRSAEVATVRIVGPATVERVERTDILVPAPGSVTESTLGDVMYTCARSPGDAPFVLQLTVPRESTKELLTVLADGGVMVGSVATLELARVLAGWPRLGSEIGDKTLPQEVRFDDIDGVSYSKGCFTGQETVARVHFRGRVNRRVLGLVWDEPPDAHDTTIFLENSAVGHVTSVVWFAPLNAWIGLGLVRREVDAGAHVAALGGSATTSDLPFALS
jgi:folate-binding protein YgfZ